MTYEYVDVSITVPIKYITARCSFQNLLLNCITLWEEILNDTFSYINIHCHNTIFFKTIETCVWLFILGIYSFGNLRVNFFAHFIPFCSCSHVVEHRIKRETNSVYFISISILILYSLDLHYNTRGYVAMVNSFLFAKNFSKSIVLVIIF